VKEKERKIVLNASVSLLWFLRDEPPELCEQIGYTTTSFQGA
jgi:hypothetical protein